MPWNIEFFREEDGTVPVQAWLDGLPDEVRGKMLARINLLAQHGPTLDFPYTSQVEGKMREVRWRFGKTRYRVLYFFDTKREGILLHGLTKNTEAIEESDKAKGRSRMKEHVERLEKQQRKSSPQKKK